MSWTPPEPPNPQDPQGGQPQPAGNPNPGPWYTQSDYWPQQQQPHAPQPGYPPQQPPYGWGPPPPPPPSGDRKGLLVAVLVVVGALLIGVVALVLATHTSKPTAAPSPSPTGPAGYVPFSDPTDGISLSVPPGWHNVDTSSPGSAQVLQQLESANPGLAAQLGSKDLKALGVKLLTLSPDGTSNLTVAAQPAPGVRDSDLTDQLDSLKAGLQTAGIDMTDNATVPLAGHQALKLTGTATFKVPNGATVQRGITEYFVAANDELYVLALNGTSTDFPTILGTVSVAYQPSP